MDRLGIVYISVAHPRLPNGPGYTGYWDRGEPPEMLEDGPGWNDVEEAVAWGRARAPRVLLRLGADESSIYSAGEQPLTRFSDGSGPAYPEWTPAGRHS